MAFAIGLRKSVTAPHNQNSIRLEGILAVFEVRLTAMADGSRGKDRISSAQHAARHGKGLDMALFLSFLFFSHFVLGVDGLPPLIHSSIVVLSS